MAVAWATAGTLATGTTSVTVSQPTGTSTGDTLVAFIADKATSGTTNGDTGWTRRAAGSGTGGRFQVYTAVVGQGGLSGTSWAWSGLTTTSCGIIHRFTGGDVNNPVTGTPTGRRNASGASGTTSTTPAVNNALIVAGFASLANGATWSAEKVATNPGALTERSDDANSTSQSIAVATGSQTTAAATGASSATMSSATNNAGVLLALAPAIDGNVTITGVGMTSAAGTVTAGVSANVSITGVGTTSAAGTLTATGAATFPLTGVAMTSAAGTLVGSAPANASITGVSTTSAVGTLSPTGAANFSLTGVSATSDVGTPLASGAATCSLTGVAMATACGTVVATGGGGATTSPESSTLTMGEGDIILTPSPTLGGTNAPLSW